MNIRKVFSITLAAALQVLPLTRVFVATTPAAGSSMAIVATWIAGAMALLGGVDAVSGASTVITSPTTARATNGVAFSYRITTGPQGANTFAAAPLPSGLTVSTTTGRITGTPTVSGLFNILLTASDNGRADRTVTANLALTIVNAAAGTAPAITTQPSSQTVTAGNNATFSVVASGTSPLSYRWRLNGANIANATNTSLTLTAVATNQAGGYSVVITNAYGAVTSSVATLTVNAPAVAPSITTQPASQTVNAGANASFSVVANGTAPLSYQWRFNGGNLSGATSSTLGLTGVTTNQAGGYSVVIANSAGSVTSSVATLTVNVPIVAPSITTQPANQTVNAGANASFSVVAGGTSPLSYQWRFNGANLSGATSSTLGLTGVSTNQAGNYSVVITNAVGSVTSSVATLTVNVPIIAPGIVTDPASVSVIAGANVSFSVVASGTAPLSYQWRRNGTAISGATSSTLALTGVTTNNAGNYTVVVTNAVGSATSAAATLTVTPAPVAPGIVTQPVNQTVTAGQNVNFSVVASGTAPMTYQWRLNGANIGGATASTLTLSAVTTNQAGGYSVVASNSVGSVTSIVATLTVNPALIAPSITADPASQSVLAGANVSFSVTASGSAPLTYQWKRNGTSIPGATSATLNLTSVTTNQSGAYLCIVTNAAGTATSGAATLTVSTPNTPPTISAISNRTITVGASLAAISFVIGDVETASTSLTLSKASTNATLLPATNITLGGSGANRTVTLTPQAGQIGSSLVTISVSDGVASASSSFLLIVEPVAGNLPTQLSLNKSGQGIVSPDLSGQSLVIGRRYSMKATPASGYEFAGWSGSTNATSPTLVFTMNSNLVFQANFVPSPFIETAGIYNGLFFEESGVQPGSSGAFKLTTTTHGLYSGMLQMGSRRHRLSGKLDLEGRATNVIARAGELPLTVELLVNTNADSGEVSGRVTDGTWNAVLSGARNQFHAVNNPAPQAGNYTFAISGGDVPGAAPEGSGFGYMRVLTNGTAMLAGVLADGTRITCTASLTPDGAWPLYVSLYRGNGAVLSWLNFDDAGADDVSGSLSWIKPADQKAKYHPQGFDLETKLYGSRYLYPIGSIATPILALPDAAMSFTGGNLGAGFSNLIQIGYYSKVTNLSSNTLKMTFSMKTGTFGGTVINPITGLTSKFQGAALQKQNIGAGFMLGTNLSSDVIISAP